MKKQGPKQRPKKGNMDKHGKTWKMQAPYKALLGLCLALAWFFSHFVLIKNWISQKSWQPQKASNKHTQREEKVSSCSVRFFLCLLLARSCVANFWLCFFCFCSAFFWLGWGSLLFLTQFIWLFCWFPMVACLIPPTFDDDNPQPAPGVSLKPCYHVLLWKVWVMWMM